MENLRETLPPGLVDAAASIPGFGSIAQFVLSKFGFDIGNVVSLYLLLFAIYQGASFVYTRGRGYFMDHGTSAIRIDDDDDLYGQFILWISAQRMTEVSRDLKASTKRPRTRSKDSDDDVSDNADSDVLDDAGFFSYEKWTGKIPVHYEPNLGDDHFTHNGHYFQFTKDEKENKYSQQWEKYVVIRCMGRSTQPIKDLIDHVKDWSGTKQTKVTEIYRSVMKQHGYRGACWECQATRPSRPIATVSLDETQKTKIVEDINEYLHPATARWYAARGIPHRRGYLFHGPPGTGKTSLSFALAGIFGLNIYCASLSERDLRESDLAKLFSQLPHRCIVLLEDIDSAGIRREGRKASEDSDSDSCSDTDSDAGDDADEPPKQEKTLPGRVAQVMRILMGTQSSSEKEDDAPNKSTASSEKDRSKSKISLAGLLNIIDGAASHEGRVLVMTTNFPEKLDSALIRPGRVDLQVKFTLATREQVREIFKRMYSSENDVKKSGKTQNAGNNTATVAQDGPQSTCTACTCGHAASIADVSRPKFVALPAERLAEMSDQFANQLPEATFSPAEIQGYLLMKKTDPNGALAGVKEWKEAMLEAKKRGKKVVDVQ